VCISPTRFYVQRAVYEDFLAAAKGYTEKLVVGDPLDAQVTNGPLVTAAGLEKVQTFVKDAVDKHATVITGGQRPDGLASGYFYQPTILTDVTPLMRISCDEVFGPVMAVKPFETLDEALALANDTPYGLAGYAITRDLTRAVRVYEGLKFGIVGINDLVPATAEGPFGGVKESGYGREGSQEGLTEYMVTKFVSIGGI